MPQIFSIISTIILTLGFYCIGRIISKYFKLDSSISIISKPNAQYASLGIVTILLPLYPLVFCEYVNSDQLKYLSFFIFFLGIFYLFLKIYKFKYLKNLILNKLHNRSLDYYIISILVILYGFLSLSPITDSDSLAYHLPVANNIKLNSKYLFETYNFTNALAGSGELLIALGLNVMAEQFGSFIHFVGLLSILGIFLKISSHKIEFLSTNFYLILGCPILLFLLSTGKPQFFYLSLIIIGYAYLVNREKVFNEKNFYKNLIIVTAFSVAALNAKINFTLSYLIINLGFFFIFIKNINKIFFLFLINFVFILFFVLPIFLQKETIYNYPFYHFAFNPLPLNIPGFSDFYLYAKQYNKDNFLVNLFFPLPFSNITNTFGLGLICIFIFFFKNFKNKFFYLFLILIFISLLYFLGQNSTRFYLDIYIFIILIFSKYINIEINKFIKLYKNILYIQVITIIVILTFSVATLFSGSLSQNLKTKTLSKYADGYLLYNWLNEQLPNKSVFLTDHRSVYFSKNYPVFVDFSFTINFNNKVAKEYMLKQIMKKNPEYIIFYGQKNKTNFGNFNFINCDLKLLSNIDSVGYLATRNPFNSSKQMYGATIYKFNYKKLPDCVIENKN